MPLLFAATLFLSASLLFMIQPMVGKMVLPLLGGSPAVWNACMVFFQMLLLMGYQYAHFMTGKYPPRKQWAIHLLVLGLPIAAFFLAVTFGARHSPIAIVESLAPGGDESSPVLSVLALLTIAIGVPFFVISTSAPLLQKWFTATGHPSARDPYFLYSASNAGSLISLLGYPFVIEPNLSIISQAWLFAIGFGLLTVLVFFCGRAAANPIGVPPASQQLAGKATSKANAPLPTAAPPEPPPTLVRKLKWVALAFVPSSLMLGVTFHMTTDIASIPLLWVIPLALYLITFIIAFGRVPDWFRIVIGNLAPVMVLLLVFVMISDVNPGYFIKMVLHILTFFAVALMCHYELARDRPSPEHLTGFFLLMSVGGVLGGIFNSLIAPLVFPHAYEYPLVLVIGCLMVPRLLAGPDEETTASPAQPGASGWLDAFTREWAAVGGLIANTYLLAFTILWLTHYQPHPISFSAGMTIPEFQSGMLLRVLLGALGGGFLWVAVLETYAAATGRRPWLTRRLWEQLPLPARIALLVVANPFVLPWVSVVVVRSRPRLRVYLDLIVPLLVGIGFYCLYQVTGLEWYKQRRENIAASLNLSEETVQAVLIFAVPVMICFFFVDRPVRFALCVAAILGYHTYLEHGSGVIHSERSFFGILKIEESGGYKVLRRGDTLLRDDNGRLMLAEHWKLRRLVHGTTLHGTQIVDHERHILDDFQMIVPNVTPWDMVAVAGAIHAFNISEEPLTYYHPTGPVGAMFRELRRRDDLRQKTDPTAAPSDVAMVGLGTGSVSCYARPGQRLTFYEIDPAVKHLVADTDKYFTYYSDAVKRGAHMEIRMGDARLKLKEDADRKYALLLVDAFSSDSIPVHLLTKEAVQLYFDRMTEDGLLGLHISNRWVRLEPVVSAIAKELGLAARVWNDDNEGPVGKTQSSWVVLARKPEYLGKLNSPLGDLLFDPPVEGSDNRARLSMDAVLSAGVRYDYDELLEISPETRRPLYQQMNQEEDPKAVWYGWALLKYADLCDPDASQRFKVARAAIEKDGVFADVWSANSEWIHNKLEGPQDTPAKARLAQYIALLRKYGPNWTHAEVMQREHGHAFRRLETLSQVPAWTDDYSDVMRVMNFPELQKVRKLFGLPNPVER